MLGKNLTSTEIKAIRQNQCLIQSEFWEAVGVTQSGGSRYENGHTIPTQILELIRIIYIEGIPLEKIKGEYIRVALALREQNQDHYTQLQQSVQP